nr:hypothetical protein [uncultured Rhodoferax sp.]
MTLLPESLCWKTMGSGLVLQQAYAIGCYSLKEIGQAFGLYYATVSLVMRAVEIELEEG